MILTKFPGVKVANPGRYDTQKGVPVEARLQRTQWWSRREHLEISIASPAYESGAVPRLSVWRFR